MDEIVVLVIILVGAFFLTPIIIASRTRTRIDSLSDQIYSLENKLDELIRNKHPIVKEEIKSTPETTQVVDLPDYGISNTYHEIPDPITIISEVPLDLPLEEIPEEINEEIPEPTYHENTVPEQEYGPSLWQKLNPGNLDLETFIGKNLISKIGIAVLVLGIAFFVKYAIDKDWINEYTRVGIGIMAGAVVLVFAHRLRLQFKAFSSVLVAGAIAIFYFTITIGFQEYQIFSQSVAFVIMIIITGFSVYISLLYDRQELAILSLIGGFAAPFMVSTGEGNYKVLFTYILTLDLGMLVIAFVRRWKLLYVLSYIFTIILYGGWYFSKVNTEQGLPYFGALFFATAFYFTFFLAGIISNIKARKPFEAVDLSMLLIFNFLYCGLGLKIFSAYHSELKGLFIIVLASVNFISAWILFKRFKADKSLLYLLIGLTLSYATLAAPIQLHGNYITLFWAAEAVVLMWLAQRSEFKIFRFTSVIVHILMLVSLVMDWQQIYSNIQIEGLPILVNKGFITSIVCLVSLASVIFLLQNEEGKFVYLDFNFNSQVYRITLINFSILIAYLTGILELNYQLKFYNIEEVLLKMWLFSYHLVFSALIVSFVLKLNSEISRVFVIILSVVNMILYLFIINDLSFEKLRVDMTFYSGFITHYISVIAFIYGTYTVLKYLIKNYADNLLGKYAWWILSFFLVFIASSELMLHVQALYPIRESVINGDVSKIANDYGKTQIQVIKVGYPILWGLLAFILLFAGMRMPQKDLRIISLALLFITLLKLFVYDIKNVSEAGKIIAFILLGVLLLIMSFMYQKIKAIILDDEK
jgi:hypothetical protein